MEGACNAGAGEARSDGPATGRAFCSSDRSNGLELKGVRREASAWLLFPAKKREASSSPGFAACAVRNVLQANLCHHHDYERSSRIAYLSRRTGSSGHKLILNEIKNRRVNESASTGLVRNEKYLLYTPVLVKAFC